MTKNSRRKYAATLLSALNEQIFAGNIDQNKLFQAVFGRAASDKENYLLRNELRHLTHRLRQFIVESQFRKHLTSSEPNASLLYLKFLLQREAQALFQLELRKEIRAAEKVHDVDARIALLQLQCSAIRRAAPKHREFQQLKSLATRIRGLLDIQYLRQKWKSFEITAFAERNETAAGYEIELTQLDQMATADLQVRDPYLHFLIAKARAYHAFGEAYIAHSTTALALLDDVQIPGFDRDQERATLLSNIALAHYLKQDYAVARGYFQQLVPLRKRIPPRTFAAILFNYISATVHDGAYAEAATLIATENEAIQASPTIRIRVAALEVASRLYLGQARQARLALLPMLDQGSEVDHFYFRTCLVIAWYQEGDLDAALRENTNIVQGLRRRGQFRMFRAAALLFAHWVRTQESIQAAAQQRAWRSLRTHWRTFKADFSQDEQATLPIRWLLEQVEAALEKAGV